jgi:DNA modification methylase
MSVRVLEGHALDVLSREQAGSYHVCVTSPPYLWLRAYGSEPQVWDAAEDCEHEWGAEGRHSRGGQIDAARDRDVMHGQLLRDARNASKQQNTGAFCARCHAWRGELGQEPTPELYVAHLVACFRAVRRVLRDDGTLWVNLSGCFFNDPGGQNGGAGNTLSRQSAPVSKKILEANRQAGRQDRTGRGHPWLKPLDWVDVPGLFAREMQQDGWIWRSDVTWVKPSALPESVSGTRWERCRVRTKPQEPRGSGLGVLNARGPGTVGRSGGIAAMDGAEWADCPGCPKCDHPDPRYKGYVLRRGNGRPTKSTERVLLFIKRPGAFFDTEAVREPLTSWELRDGRMVHTTGGQGYGVTRHAEIYPGGKPLTGGMAPGARIEPNPAGRNLRDWWVLSPEPIADAHYAAFPTALPDRCIKAGTSEWGCCPACGSPWARVVERSADLVLTTNYTAHAADGKAGDAAIAGSRTYDGFRGGDATMVPGASRPTTTLGWRPTCGPGCPGATEPPVPCRVLDPFGGSGATALAANRLGRDCVLVELKPAYAALARTRIGREPLSLFASRPEEVPV